MHLTSKANVDTLMVIVLLAMMGIKALFFGNKDEKVKQRLIDLNQELNDMYKELAQEQDTFEQKRRDYEKDLETITSKKNEVDNRLDYLTGVKAEMAGKLTLPDMDFNEFREFKKLCEQYVATFNGIEEAQTEVHGLEVELETTYANWDDESKAHEVRVDGMQKNIQQVLAVISRVSGKKK